MRLFNYLNEASLTAFDKDVYNTIEGKEHMFLRKKEGIYYTIIHKNDKVGIVGFNNT